MHSESNLNLVLTWGDDGNTGTQAFERFIEWPSIH